MSVRPAPDAPTPLPKPLAPVPTLLRDLVHENTGIHFDDERLDLMIEKLEARAVATRCLSYLDYYYLLKYDDQRREEWLRVMDAFSVQETYFWRELDQIRALVEVVVPAWFRQTSEPFRIWSAACATGEEPYSIVMALHEAGWGGHPIEVIASDASESALKKARAAVYRERSFRSLPHALKEKYFHAQPDGWAIDPKLRSRVTFHWANLVALDDVPALGSVHAIFCRNVFIYFSPATIKRVAASFAQRLPAKGHLFIGASESLLKLTTQFELEEVSRAFAYVRNDVR